MLFQSKNSIVAIVMLCIAMTTFLGCTKEEPTEPAGSLSGLVYSGVEPISKCRVKIFNKQTLNSFMINVAEGGKYEFKDIPLGDYSLAVVQEAWYEASEAPFDKRIPRRYRDVKKSGFTVLVEAGPTEYDIKMKK